jgi:uncharacterized membrane protein YkoI
MKSAPLIGSIFVLGISFWLLAGCASETERVAGLEKKAKISRSQAEKIAVARFPNAIVKDSGIQKLQGTLIWSMDLATPGTDNITQVAVDATTGAVLAVGVDKPGAEGARPGR